MNRILVTLTTVVVLGVLSCGIASAATPPTPQSTGTVSTPLLQVNLCSIPEDPDPFPTISLDIFEPGEACGCRLWWLVQVCTPMPDAHEGVPGAGTVAPKTRAGDDTTQVGRARQ